MPGVATALTVVLEKHKFPLQSQREQNKTTGNKHCLLLYILYASAF